MRRKKKINRGNVIKHAVLMAEDLFPGPKTGKAKREFVIDLINSKVNIPVLNERQEEVVIGLLVDLVHDLLFKKAD
tara:strand:- start:1800 stop:2027 length:228 start_codon:yes stop_codon:yes gene_type:complete